MSPRRRFRRVARRLRWLVPVGLLALGAVGWVVLMVVRIAAGHMVRSSSG